jgi:hypothetical protein
MTQEQAAAFVFSQSVAALAAIEGCKAANAQRERCGEGLAYDERAIAGIPDEFGIGHNAVMTLFIEVNNR